MLTLDSSAAVWSAEKPGAPLLVLLHGYGSHEHDLVSLAAYLPTAFRTVSVRAPLTAGPGYAWVPIVDPGRPEAQATQEATEAVLAWLDENVPAETPVALLGFSQGGLMVTHLMRNRPTQFFAGVVLSGFVADTTLPTDAELAAVHPPVFFGRGDRDPIISPEAFQRIHEWLPQHCDTTEVVYPGLAHSISDQELRDIWTFLDGALHSVE